MSHHLPAALRALPAALLLLVLLAWPAEPHAELSPTRVGTDQEVALTVTSIVERAGRINTEFDVVVPWGFEVLSCQGPQGWSCSNDTRTHAPNTTVRFRPQTTPRASDASFTVLVRTPSADRAGTYLLHSLQTHDDDWLEPWVYEDEPYIAPRIVVGSGGGLVNGPGSRIAPCVGPASQPLSYDTADGSGANRTPCPKAAPAPSPTPSPSPRPSPSPSPSPTATTVPSPTTSPTTAPSPDASPSPTTTDDDATPDPTASPSPTGDAPSDAPSPGEPSPDEASPTPGPDDPSPDEEPSPDDTSTEDPTSDDPGDAVVVAGPSGGGRQGIPDAVTAGQVTVLLGALALGGRDLAGRRR